MTPRKVFYLLPKKDKIPNSSPSNIVHEFTSPGCNSSYILGKTEGNLATRLWEHLDPLKTSIPKHLSECEHDNFILNLNHIFDNFNDINDSDTDKPHTPLSFHNFIKINTKFFTLVNILTLTFCFSLKLYISNIES